MQSKALEAIFQSLHDAEVKYVVVGGLAVVAHGYARTTGDVDLVVGLEPENIIRGLKSLEKIGYKMSLPVTPEQFADKELREKWRREKGMLVLKMWSDEHRWTPIDIFVYEPFDMNEEWASASRIEWTPGLKVPVVTKETLLKMKRDAGRPQDLADIAELESIRG